MRKVRIIMIGILAVGVLCMLAMPLWARGGKPSSEMINLQGRLTDLGGNPVPAGTTVNMTFTIYRGTTTPMWTETQSVTIGENGIFNVNLGAVNAIENVFDISYSYRIGIAVGSDSEMTPRQLVVAVPFAIVAWSLEGGNVKAHGASAYPAVYATNGSGNAVEAVSLSSTGGHGVFAEAWSNEKSGIYAIGKRGVIGFQKDNPIDHSGNYGLLGGAPLPAGGLIVTGITSAGAYGQVDAENYGYLGYYFRSLMLTGTTKAGVLGKSVTGYGVYGASDSSPGVYGFGRDGIGVVGVGSAYPTGYDVGDALRGRAGVRGLSEAGPGVEGRSSSGHGVYGETSGVGNSGVYGIASGSGWFGVYGESANSIGVYGRARGTGQTGVYGNGAYGVKGNGSVTGVRGDGYSYGLYGRATNSGGIGVFATNAAGGTALEIGDGGIKIPRDEATCMIDQSSVTINAVAGVATVYSDSARGITVFNDKVTSNSIIIATPQNTRLNVGVGNIGSERFTLYVPETSTTPIKVGFIVINN